MKCEWRRKKRGTEGIQSGREGGVREGMNANAAAAMEEEKLGTSEWSGKLTVTVVIFSNLSVNVFVFEVFLCVWM